MTPRVPPLGAHLSIAGGVWRAVERALELGCTALQIFTQAPGRWEGRAIPDDEAGRFREAARGAGLAGVTFAHAPYLVNVASGEPDLRGRSLDLLAGELARSEALELAGVVLHPGAHRGDGRDVGIERAAAGIVDALARVPGRTPVLVEVTAGQGTTLGRDLADIAELLQRLPAPRAGVCWDTAHLWAAGYDVASEEGWERLWLEFREVTGRSAPDLVHLNDTEVEIGSRRDRHARVGYGRLGYDTFARIVTDRRLATVPMVLETPKGPDDITWDREALEFLRAAAHGRPWPRV